MCAKAHDLHNFHPHKRFSDPHLVPCGRGCVYSLIPEIRNVSSQDDSDHSEQLICSDLSLLGTKHAQNQQNHRIRNFPSPMSVYNFIFLKGSLVF